MLDQCFSTLVLGPPPSTAHYLYLPNQTHLIHLSSLEETPGRETGASDKCAVLGDAQDQGWETLC